MRLRLNLKKMARTAIMHREEGTVVRKIPMSDIVGGPLISRPDDDVYPPSGLLSGQRELS